MSLRRIVSAAAAGAALIALSACVAPNGTVITPSPGGGVVITPPGGGTGGVSESQLSGSWCFVNDRDRERQRNIQIVSNGMIVSTPRGTREYVRTGSGRYEEVNGSSVYIFNSLSSGVFSRDGTRTNAFDLYRCGTTSGGTGGGYANVDTRLAGNWCFVDNSGRQQYRTVSTRQDGIVLSNQFGSFQYRAVGGGRFEQVGGPSVIVFNSLTSGSFSRDGSRAGTFNFYRC